MDSQPQIQPRDVNMRGINMKQGSENEMTPLAFFKVACAYDRWFTRTHKLIFATQGHENFGCDEKLQGLKSQDHKLIVRMAKVTRWAARPQTNIYACSLLNNMTTQVLPRSVTVFTSTINLHVYVTKYLFSWYQCRNFSWNVSTSTTKPFWLLWESCVHRSWTFQEMFDIISMTFLLRSRLSL